jgi:hypothetical protein
MGRNSLRESLLAGVVLATEEVPQMSHESGLTRGGWGEGGEYVIMQPGRGVCACVFAWVPYWIRTGNPPFPYAGASWHQAHDA